MQTRRSFFLCISSCLLGVLAPLGTLSAQETAKRELTDTVLVLGASVSAGFCLDEPLGGSKSAQYAFHHHLAAAFATPLDKVHSAANRLFFMNVPEGSKLMQAKVAEVKPTLTVGVDFLFWFGYGRMNTEDERLAAFEKGLALAAEIPGTLVLGDLPDASAAAVGKGSMLSPKQVPKPETIVTMNKRLHEWAKERPNVLVLPVSAFMAASVKDEAIQIGPVEMPAGSTRKLLQADLLHCGRHGCAALALTVANALVEKNLLPKDRVQWEVDTIYQTAIARARAGKATQKSGVTP